MRTKALLCAAALAAVAISSMAQSNVYSLNVVGYVNKGFTFGATTYIITTPLNTPDNSLASLIPTPPEGTAIYVYDPTIDDFTNNYNFNGGSWDFPATKLTPGPGFFIYVPEPFTNTFVGEVPQGALSQTVVGGGTVTMLGNLVPIAGDVPTVMTGYVPAEGDTIYQWDPTPAVQDLAGNESYNAGSWSGTITSIETCEAFLLYRADPGTTWTRNFTVQ